MKRNTRIAFILFITGVIGFTGINPSFSQEVYTPTSEERSAQFGIVESALQTEDVVNVIILVEASSGKQSALVNTIQSISTRPVQTYSNFPLMALQVDQNGLSELRQNASILGIEEDIPHEPHLSESTSLIGANASWSDGYTGDGQVVAILDTGSHLEHDFIKNKIVAEACYSKNVSGTSTSLCPGALDTVTGSGSSAACDVNTLGTACNHGTGVAGVAAGERFGAYSFDGVAPDADIISINVFSNHSGSVLAWSSDYIAGLDYVYSLRNTYNIAAANLSLGGGQYNSASTCDAARPSTKTAADQLKAAGIAVIASSGNDGYTGHVGAPSCISSIISVGSTTKADAISSFSNHDEIVDLLAPGSSITTSWNPGDAFSAVNGTSFSAPTVTGAWALIREADNSSTVDQLLQVFKDSGEDITGRSGIAAIPRIQVDSAISNLDCIYDWRLSISVTDRNKANTSVRIGQGTGNTDTLDTSCGESKLPPNPPAGVFSITFDLPGDTLISANDYRSTEEDTAQWKLNISGRRPYTLRWDPTELPSGFFRLRDNIDGSYVKVDMKASSSYRLTNKNVTELIIQRSETGSCESIRFDNGWNMVSFPLDPLDDRSRAIFKSRKISLYGFDGNAYTTPSTVSPGNGYWVFFRRPKTITFCGYDAGTTVSVTEGWNMVAGHDVNMDVDDITSTPSNIIKTDFFTFDRGYSAVDSLKKEKAYWVRVSADGILNVQSSGKRSTLFNDLDYSDKDVAYLYEREADSSYAVITFTDANKIKQTLFYQSAFLTEEDRDYYLLPPIAPGAYFDARFSDNLQVSDQISNPDTLVLQGFTSPIEVTVENLPYQQLRLYSTKYETVYELAEGRPATLPSDGAIYTIEGQALRVSTEFESNLPGEVILYQSYPNPANETSLIRIGLPAAMEVRVRVYNILGQQIVNLHDGLLQAGYHELSLDATTIPAGTYLYTLETGTNRKVRRLTVVH